MNDNLEQADVVVVGGGMAGLTAAAYLARAGRSVVLFEKAVKLGGLAATTEQDGYYFNRGAHALYKGGATEKALAELGVVYGSHTPKGVYALMGGKLHIAPADTTTLFRTTLLNFADKVEFMKMFATFPMIKAAELRNVSLRDWLASVIHRPTTHAFLSAFAATYSYSSATDLISAEVFVAKMQLFMKHGVTYIDNGWQSLVDGLRSVAEKAGAKIISDCRVEAVEQENGAITGVRLVDGRFIGAGAVVVATTPHDAAKLLGSIPATEKLRQQINAFVPGQLAALDVALKRLITAKYPVAQDVDMGRFLTTQSLFAHLAPEGGATISLFKPLDPRQDTDPRQDERDLEQMLDIVQPGWRDVLVRRSYLPRINAVGALPLAATNGFAGRPAVQAQGVANLYLAGDWVGPEGFLVDASVASARAAARLISQLQVKSPELAAQKVA